MPHLQQIGQETTSALAQEAFAGLGCTDFGLVVMRGDTSWGTHDTGLLTLPGADGPFELRIAYDEREAPYVIDATGAEQQDLLISLADEGDVLVCAWARTSADSPLRGVGVDLASTVDFDSNPARQHFIELLFGQTEHQLVREGWPHDPALGYATAFGAKEAAFKATARPLRTWYCSHSEELSFEVRHFSLVNAHTARGEQRNAAAQRAMDKMGIVRIAVNYAQLGDAALVIACALA